MPLILAHGALGNFDELLFLGIGILFVSMMGISWLRSRANPPALDGKAGPEPPPAVADEPAAPESVSADRFPLE